MAEQPLTAGQSYDIKIAGKKTRARVDGIQFQVDINNLTHRDVSELPLNGIGLVDMTFDEAAGAGSVSAESGDGRADLH